MNACLILLLLTSLTWENGTPMPTPRYGFGIGVVGGKIYVLGGRDDVNVIDVIEVYDPETDTWDSSATRMPTPRCFVGSAVYDSKIYIMGGMTDINIPRFGTNLVERYDPVIDQWDTVTSMIHGKEALSTCLYQDKIYAIGGYEYPDSFGVYSRTVERYDPQSNQWVQVDSLTIPRINLGAVVTNSQIYAVGGQYYNALNSIECYVENMWSLHDTPMPTPRYGLGVESFVDNIYVIGGYNNSTLLPTVDVFYSDSFWFTGPNLNEARAHFGVALIADTLYVMGGVGMGGPINSLEYLPIVAAGTYGNGSAYVSTDRLLPPFIRRGTRISLPYVDEIVVYNCAGIAVRRARKAVSTDIPEGVYFIQIKTTDGVTTVEKAVIIE